MAWYRVCRLTLISRSGDGLAYRLTRSTLTERLPALVPPCPLCQYHASAGQGLNRMGPGGGPMVKLPIIRLRRTFGSLSTGTRERVERKRQPVYTSKRQILALGLVIVVALIAIYSWQQHSRSKRTRWPSARVSTPEFRTILIQVLERERGSHVVYQAQAHVSYTVGGKQFNAWLPILSQSDNHQLLQLELNQLRSSPCYVHWSPEHPNDAFLSCDKSP